MIDIKNIVDTTQNYIALSLAIIKQAIKDYEHCRKQGSQRYIYDVKRFFNSQWFQQLTNVDGPSLFKQIESNFDEYGKCILIRDRELGDDEIDYLDI